MSKNFELGNLVPEPMTISYLIETEEVDDNGDAVMEEKFCKVRSMNDFSPLDLVKIEALQFGIRSKNGASKKMKAKQTNESTNRLFDFLAPDMPKEHRDKIGFLWKTRFITWWTNEGKGVIDPERLKEIEAMTQEEIEELGESLAN